MTEGWARRQVAMGNANTVCDDFVQREAQPPAFGMRLWNTTPPPSKHAVSHNLFSFKEATIPPLRPPETSRTTRQPTNQMLRGRSSDSQSDCDHTCDRRPVLHLHLQLSILR